MKLSAVLVLVTTLSACGGAGPSSSTGDPAVDADGDGYPGSTDCDDTNADVHPYADEVCNGIDDDCDDVIDPDKLSVYADSDGDGFGAGDVVERCDSVGFADNANDCDDTNADVSPGAVELCDGIDNNCDGSVDPDKLSGYVDADADGYGAGSLLEVCDDTGMVDVDGDCDDTNVDINPLATESCDGVDDDCDGLVDDDDTNTIGRQTFYVDADGDTYGSFDQTALACAAPTGFVSNSDDCDDSNADRNPQTQWFTDDDGDGYGVTSTPLSSCVPPSGYALTTDDCDDTDDTVHPSAIGACEDFDVDCDGAPEFDHDDDSYWRAACGGVDCDDEDGTKTPTAGGGCTLYNDCRELQRAFPNALSGTYWFDVVHAAPHQVEMTCDMHTDGGGWTLATNAAAGALNRCISNTSYKPPFALARQVAQKWAQDDRMVGGKLLSQTTRGLGRPNSTLRLTLKAAANQMGQTVTPSVYEVLDFNNTTYSWGTSTSFFTVSIVSGPTYSHTVYWNGTATGGKKIDYCIGGLPPGQATTNALPQICLPDGTYAAHCKDLGIGSSWESGGLMNQTAHHQLYIRPPL